jgi:hypothetical protein
VIKNFSNSLNCCGIAIFPIESVKNVVCLLWSKDENVTLAAGREDLLFSVLTVICPCCA